MMLLQYMEDLSEFEWSIVKNELIPLLKENISLQIKAGAEIIMIFDSAANQLNSADFDKYIRLVFKEIVLNFNNKVGYYAKDGVDYLLIENIKNDKATLQKMIFLINALEDGWSVKKDKESYVFTKKHENKREIFQENYLERFLISNFSQDVILKNNSTV